LLQAGCSSCCPTNSVKALKVIATELLYTLLLILAGVDTLESRRDQLTEHFFTRSVLPESSCLHYLLPDKRDTSVTGRLRQAIGLFTHSHVELCKISELYHSALSVPL